MIEKEEKRSPNTWARRWWQAAFALLLTTVILFEAVPEVSANALNLLTDGISGAVLESVESERIVMAGVSAGEADVVLEAGRKVIIRQDEVERYATSRSGETVSVLLMREGVNVGALDLVYVDLTGDDIVLEIGTDITYYETASEPVAFQTVTVPDYTLAKGDTVVTQQGIPGYRDITYEVIYADGLFVSRQAVAEGKSTAVDQIVSVGTLVTEAQSGDTIDSVVRNEDGSGYLLLKSGDSLHYSRSMDVTCTAYTANVGVVGTITATGTKVHTGVVAVDRSVIPLGSRMFITTSQGDITYGMGVAEDTGVRGTVVDLYMNSYNECMQFGRRSSIVYFLDN